MLAEVKSAALRSPHASRSTSSSTASSNSTSTPVPTTSFQPRPTVKGAIPVPEFAKREDVLRALCGRVQPWYRIAIGGDEPFTKKGALRPITVATKARQGRKACLFITGFEQFHLSGILPLPRHCECVARV